MTKKDFVKQYGEITGESQKRAGELVDSFLGLVETKLVGGENVQFVGWGTFEVKESSERMGRNPKTGEAIKIPAKKTAKFKVGKKLQEKING